MKKARQIMRSTDRRARRGFVYTVVCPTTKNTCSVTACIGCNRFCGLDNIFVYCEEVKRWEIKRKEKK